MILLIAISGLTVMARYYGQIPLKMQLYTNNMLDLTIVTRKTLQSYITKVILSVDGAPRLYIAQTIISTNNTQYPIFRGVIVSSIKVITLGKFLEAQLAPQFRSTIGMLDKEGQIIYSTDQSTIGQNAFGKEFQSSCQMQ